MLVIDDVVLFVCLAVPCFTFANFKKSCLVMNLSPPATPPTFTGFRVCMISSLANSDVYTMVYDGIAFVINDAIAKQKGSSSSNQITFFSMGRWSSFTIVRTMGLAA